MKIKLQVNGESKDMRSRTSDIVKLDENCSFCTHLGYNTTAPCGENCPKDNNLRQHIRKVMENIENEKIKKEFDKLEINHGWIPFHKEMVVEFWLQKIADREREICEEVEKLKISKTVCDPGGKIGNVYNKALEDVLKIIKK